MQEKPLVSILMTAYNREKYIAEAIESVMASTYQNWELIIVDDGSKDKTVEIAKSYEAKDKRIKVYINEKNLGDYPNRNKAASYANGKYLKYVDADDMIYPYGLEQLVFYMEEFPEAGYGLCSLPQDKERIYPFLLTPGQAYRRHYIEDKWLFHKAPLSSIIRKEVFEAVGGFSGKRMVGDFEMWNILSRNYNVLLMPAGIVWYREHNDSEMQFARDNAVQMFQYFLTEYEVLNSNACPLTQKEKQIAIRKILKKQARNILFYIRKKQFSTARMLYRMSNVKGRFLKALFYKENYMPKQAN
jgi:glycosyltransferase involved in cell wall biosynthesis